ncbi:MAG TPA: 3-ketoacyl-ACP reductase [Candidatus Mediterraneibacter quadrami]|uniref:3-ketoacyl-ACP reductase n=1 Tax=Candidatus Mediterraneibacter quadrami TaxID=2838684 RepID=A0A9D2U8K3_9FIRM|nr:3-ketoacyl-ACP reductase [Candidatus Mediterraneibacter quadrami]
MKKTAIVTGAGRGIGFAIAKRLAEAGFQLALVASSPEEKYKDNLEILKAAQADFCYIQADLSKNEDRIRCVETVIGKYGRMDVLVNNAGVAPKERRDLLDMTEESFDRLIAVNTKSVMFLSQLAAKQMLMQDKRDGVRGIIVNISSMSANVTSVNRGEYCVSKAGVSMLTKLYADRLAGDQIYVYEIRPGIIETDMTETVHEKYSKLFREGGCPIARWGKPEDVADAAEILCSGRLKYTTGQILNVDGGFQIQRL